MEFSCSAKHFGDRLVLTVAGDVDLSVHTRFEADVDKSWDGSLDLTIDCSRVTFMDSMGLRVLVQTMNRAAENDRDFALAAPSEPVVRVLELSGVGALFPVVGPVADTAPGSVS